MISGLLLQTALAWSATCGTIRALNDSQAVYKPTTTGVCRVIVKAGTAADTANVSVLASVVLQGVPFGPSQQIARTGTIQPPFTLTMDSPSPSNIVSRINTARTAGYHLLLPFPGGSHDAYLSTINGVYQFDRAKYFAAVDAFNTATIRQALTQAVTDGTVVGLNIMDEPYVCGSNTWGPCGTMTKARVDSLCGYIKTRFPGVPVGPEAQHQLFEPTKSYRVCDFYVDQYKAAYGSVTTWRDAGLAMAQRDGHSVMFAMNILDGGVQDKDGTYDCTGTGQAGLGTYSPNCRMTAQQVKDWGLVLGVAGCGGLYLWRYDATFVGRTDNQASFAALKDSLGRTPRKVCVRS